VLDDFQRQYNVEPRVAADQRGDVAHPVINRETARCGMRARNRNCAGIGVDAGNRETEPGHRLGNEAAAAADIRKAETGKRRERGRVATKMRDQLAADEIEARGVYLMERAKAAARIPPARAVPGEPIDVPRVYRAAEIAHPGGCRRSPGSMKRRLPYGRLMDYENDMARIVQKFGGTSVGDLDRIRNAAARVKREVEAGNEVAVVVSAMAGATNQLVDWTRQINPLHDAREYDVVVSSGEQVTAGLMALALQALGVDARSWLGWQVPIHTDEVHGKARIEAIETAELERRLSAGQVGVVAGFQGLGPRGRITTLGRGGSDTSAVALAAALKADRCDIFTDVDGVYTSDPRIVAKAQKLDRITYEEMLEMASQGARVLQTRSVEMAMNHRVRLQVLSSFSDAPGTLVVDEDEIVEKRVVSGIAYSRDEAKITVQRVADRPGVAAAIFGPLADHAINVDMIVQNVSEDGKTTDLTFTVARSDLDRAVAVLDGCRRTLGYYGLKPDPNVVKISVIGVGMRSHAGVAKQMFQTLADKGINIQVISTSEIKVSVLIAAEYTELAVRALHTAYGLDNPG
jgi:aspartate kinase